MFFFMIFGFWNLFSDLPPRTALQVEEIDQQIYYLSDVKRGYEGRALRHENLGEELQFRQRDYLESRRHFEIAEENREKARETQKQIDALTAKRERLVNQYQD